MALERTFSMIKPDATRRNLTGAITRMLEEAGLQVFLFEAATPWPGAFPARLMVPEDEADLARRLIVQAEA